MEKIHVDTDVLRMMSGRLHIIDRSLLEIEVLMINLSADDERTWCGKAEYAAEQDFKAVIKRIRQLRTELKKRSESIEEAAGVYEKTENSSIKKVQDLSIDHIFA